MKINKLNSQELFILNLLKTYDIFETETVNFKN